MRRRILGLAVLCGGLLWAAAGVAAAGGGGGAVCDGFAGGSELEMRDSCFAGTAHFVAGGSTLTVVNDGEIEHNLTAVDGSLATGPLGPGEQATIQVPEAGTLRVYCTLHGAPDGTGMAGVLITDQERVEAAAAVAEEPQGPWGPLVWWSGAVVAGAALALTITRTVQGRTRRGADAATS